MARVAGFPTSFLLLSFIFNLYTNHDKIDVEIRATRATRATHDTGYLIAKPKTNRMPAVPFPDS